MMHNTCSPAATPRECRAGVQSTLAQKAFSARTMSPRKMDFIGNDEPSLDELMDDDLVRRVMDRDGLQPHQVWSFLDDMRSRLR